MADLDRVKVKEAVATEGKAFLRDDLAGVDEWKQSKIGYLTGVTAARKAAAAQWRFMSGSAKSVAKVFGMVFRKEVAEPLPTDSDDASIRFSVAQEVYGRTDADISDDQTATNRMFLLYFTAFIAALSIGFLSFGYLKPIFPAPFDWIMRFIALPPTIALMLRAGFYNWQLRTRRLGSMMEYVTTPSSWLPSPAGPQAGTRLNASWIATILAVVAASMMVAFPAFAADPTSQNIVDQLTSRPGSEDLWYRLLVFVFPIIEGEAAMAARPATLAIGNAFGQFISVLMAIGATMMSWHLVIGTANTAHEGKVLGQRWNTMWAPMRVAIGMGALVPAIGGYCVAQLLALQIAVVGGNLANTVWDAYVRTLTIGQVEAPPPVANIDLVRDVAMVELCYQTVKAFNDKSIQDGKGPVSISADGKPLVPEYPTVWRANGLPDVDTLGNLVAYGRFEATVEQPYILDYGLCGKIELTAYLVGDEGYGEPHAAYDTKRMQAINQLRVSARKLVEPIVKMKLPNGEGTNEKPDFKVFMRDLGVFNTTLGQAYGEFMTVLNQNTTATKVYDQMVSNGWAGSGTYYLTLMRLYSSAHTLTRKSLTVTVGADGIGTEAGNEIEEFLISTDRGTIPAFMQFWQEGMQSMGGILASGNIAQDLAAADQAASNPLGAINIPNDVVKYGETDPPSDLDGLMNSLLDGKSISRGLVEIMAIDLDPSGKGQTALQAMMEFGHTIMTIFWALVLLWLAASLLESKVKLAIKASEALSNKLSNVSTMAKGFSMLAKIGGFMMTLLSILALILLAVGIVHAYVLPLVPFITMTFFTFSMLILVAEAVIAAPLWAFFHIRMDGQEFVDSAQRPGYMILFNLLLRPSLALFGLYFASLIFDAGAWLIGQTFGAAVIGMFGSHGFELLGIIVAMVIMTFMHYQMAMRSFQLCSAVPDRVSRWFGASPDGDGSDDRDTKAAGAIITSQVEGRVQSTLKAGGAAHAVGGAKDALSKAASAADNASEGGGSASKANRKFESKGMRNKFSTSSGPNEPEDR